MSPPACLTESSLSSVYGLRTCGGLLAVVGFLPTLRHSPRHCPRPCGDFPVLAEMAYCTEIFTVTGSTAKSPVSCSQLLRAAGWATGRGGNPRVELTTSYCFFLLRTVPSSDVLPRLGIPQTDTGKFSARGGLWTPSPGRRVCTRHCS